MQFNPNFDEDFVLIHDGNSTLLSRLTGPDLGPKSLHGWSNWNKKIISSSGNQMLIEFRSDELEEWDGFFAHIQFTPLQSQMCESWLNMNNKTLLSPNYPMTHNSNMSCNWLITVRHGFHIELKFHKFDVSI